MFKELSTQEMMQENIANCILTSDASDAVKQSGPTVKAVDKRHILSIERAIQDVALVIQKGISNQPA